MMLSEVSFFNIYSMGFYDKIKRILEDKKPRTFSKTCVNFWCKAPFEVLEDDLEKDVEFYSQCPKCRSFSTQLSGGVTNNGVREYEGERMTNDVHEVEIRRIRGFGF